MAAAAAARAPAAAAVVVAAAVVAVGTDLMHQEAFAEKNVQEDEEKNIKSVKGAKRAKRGFGVVHEKDVKFINKITNKFNLIQVFL